MTREEAIEWMQEEKARFERAPDLNGCPMTEDWQKAIDVYDMAISALRKQEHFRDVTKKIEPLTNADRIRAMSDEELADFLAYTWATSARAWQKDPGETLHWLQMPEKEDDNA